MNMNKDKFKFSYREDDIEIRISRNLNGGIQPEMVVWAKSEVDNQEYCYTILYWVENGDGDWDVRFVGSRPYETFAKTITPSIWQAMRYMNEFLKLVSENED